ncbi:MULTISPECIES: benenodin family lasso peptide [Rhodanobacter]|nr:MULTISPECIES: benenodin family lasso peptide [Rhodanobacter]UJJ53926.1 benenodin family lasso peptide [Rhodanobacter thiooxydans]
MDTNENIRSNAQDDVIELGVASVETKGPGGPTESGGGLGKTVIPGISEE